MSLAAALTFGACGGGEKPPQPLHEHFDDMYIAAIPIEQKQSIVQTQQDYSVGKMENAKTDADANEAATQLTIARNDHKAAELAVSSAKSTRDSAQASADTNRMNDAAKELHAAESAEKAAAERLHYMEAYSDYLRVLGYYTAENMFWHESQFELAKADLAQKNNIAPKGFVFAHYADQEHDRNVRAQARKHRVDEARQHVADVRDRWLHAQDEAERETGKRNQYPDPLAPGASR